VRKKRKDNRQKTFHRREHQRAQRDNRRERREKIEFSLSLLLTRALMCPLR
jgi:hypothetical protein